MPVLTHPAAFLAWLGRQGTRAVATLVIIGVAVPPLGVLLKPFLSVSVFLLLVLTFLRVEPQAIRTRLARPGLVMGASLWVMLAQPALLISLYWLTGLEAQSPDLFLALLLQAATTPMMSSPAIAALMGLDAALVLTSMVACTVLLPLTAPLFVRLFADEGLTLSPLALGLILFGMLAGAALIAAIIRRLAGAERIGRRKEEIDGLNVLLLLVFVCALMHNVAARTFAEPLLVIALTALAVAISLVMMTLTAIVFRPAARRDAFALGLMASQRNTGLMLAATAGALPDLVWLYFALAQFPIYLAPYLLGPLARRINGTK
jgi:BASS family bile acid:Na+ symporter